MALRAVTPEEIKKRIKLFMYGPAGIGKTTTAISFPRPYLIDTERGAENDQYVKTLKEQGGAIFQTSDFGDMLTEVTSLLTEQHEYRTLIIDPFTVVYNDLLDKAAKSLATREDPEGMAFGRHRTKADRQVKHLLNLLLRLDMNVVMTSHAKILWGDGMTKLGITFDCYAKLDYLFDLMLELARRGQERVAIVRKTRIKEFPEDDVMPVGYEEIAERYGREVLEKQATPQALATKEQVDEILDIVKLLHISEETCQKWLDKAGAENWGEMPELTAARLIEQLHKKIAGKGKETK